MWLLTGRWFVYPLLWLGPWLTGWRVVNRLRALGEHGGLAASKDRRLTTHNVPVPSRTLLARALQYRLASRPPCRHGYPMAESSTIPRRTRTGRLHRRDDDLSELSSALERVMLKGSAAPRACRRPGGEPSVRMRRRRWWLSTMWSSADRSAAFPAIQQLMPKYHLPGYLTVI